MAWPPRTSPTALTPFAVALRRLRKERGWTQADLGRKSGLGQSTLSSWERDEGNGRKPDLGELVKLARAFKLTPEALGRLILPPPDRPESDPSDPGDGVEIIERRNPRTGERLVALVRQTPSPDPFCELCSGIGTECVCRSMREEVYTLPPWVTPERLRLAAEAMQRQGANNGGT